jgi:hypothetical protein
MYFYGKYTSTALESTDLFSVVLSSSDVIKQRLIFVVIFVIVIVIKFDRRVFMATMSQQHI